MSRGHQWIHFDAQFPLKFGHDLCERFGPAGELLFVLFLCGCKRSYPQGQISYRTEEELRVTLGAHFDFVDNAGDKWSLSDFWRWCGKRKVTRTKTLNTRRYVTATRWDTWEDDRNSKERERKRRSRAESVRGRPHWRLEVGVLEGESVRGGHDDAPPAEQGAPPPAPPTLRNNGTNPRARRTNPRTRNGAQLEPTARPVPDWTSEPEPADTIDRAALDALRSDRGWTKPPDPT